MRCRIEIRTFLIINFKGVRRHPLLLPMKLEEAISQDYFVTEHQKLLINLIYTQNWLVAHVKDFLSDYDLTLQQFNILRILRGQHPDPIGVNVIRDRMLDKMSDASRVVERLRIKGLVERNPNKTDRRCVEVKITQKGLDLLAKVDEKSDFFDQLMGNLDAEEAEKVNAMLDKLRG